MMLGFIEAHRQEHGVEPICKERRMRRSDRPIDISLPCRPADRSVQGAGPLAKRCGAECGYPADLE
jgi:hypothetical protein